VLRGRVLLHKLRQFIDQGRTERTHPLKVDLVQPNDELVRHENAVSSDDSSFRVELTAQCRCDLDGLKTALEGLGEGTVDRSLKTSLEVVQ
jgi:hypothetical protein